MGALNKYRVTMMGADDLAGAVNARSITIWVRGIEDRPKLIGEASVYAGHVTNDSGLMVWGLKMPLVPFGLLKDGIAGHDNWLYLQLTAVLSKRYKFITAVAGEDMMIGGSEAVHDDQMLTFMAELLVKHDDLIPVKLVGMDVQLPYDGTREVTLDLELRKPGLELI